MLAVGEPGASHVGQQSALCMILPMFPCNLTGFRPETINNDLPASTHEASCAARERSHGGGPISNDAGVVLWPSHRPGHCQRPLPVHYQWHCRTVTFSCAFTLPGGEVQTVSERGRAGLACLLAGWLAGLLACLGRNYHPNTHAWRLACWHGCVLVGGGAVIACCCMPVPRVILQSLMTTAASTSTHCTLHTRCPCMMAAAQ
jgi:hypothetical protein